MVLAFTDLIASLNRLLASYLMLVNEMIPAKERALMFKQFAEEVMGKKLSDVEYSEILISKGIEAMLRDVISGGLLPSTKNEETLWNTVIGLLERNPREFVAFALEVLKKGDLINNERARKEAENWKRYIR